MRNARRELGGRDARRRGELGRRVRELGDHARLGRGVRDALDDHLVLVDRLAVARQRARGLDGAVGE